MTSENPFGGMPMFGDLARMMAASGPVNWDVARQLSGWLAVAGEVEANVEPAERIGLEELWRVAELRMADVAGVTLAAADRLVAIQPLTRGQWANQALEDLSAVFERLARSLTSGSSPGGGTPGASGTSRTAAAGNPEPAEPAGPAGPPPWVSLFGLGGAPAAGAWSPGGGGEGLGADLMGQLGRMISPILLGVQAGTMAGHLARRVFGNGDLPLPRAAGRPVVVPANLDEFGQAWSLPSDDLRLWSCLRELAAQSVLSRPHVAAHLDALINQFITGFRLDPAALESTLGEFDPTDPSGLASVFSRPEALLGLVRTPAQQEVAAHLDSLVAALVGWTDHVVGRASAGFVGSYDRLAEALRRRRGERGDGDNLATSIIGLDLSPTRYEAGSEFVAGVLSRGGEEALARLWSGPWELPTPAEIDAPGLWLARIDLPQN
ncbi:MAG: zinc-dependent metalloprotease [Acidimicrobiales bacterium]